MIRDTSLIMQMQLAIMGVVLVFGLFYLWRSTCRMEEKMDVLMQRISDMEITRCKCPVSSEDVNTIDPSDAEEFMKQVFGGDMMFVPQEGPSVSKPVVVEEIVEEAHEQESEADTETTNPLSKSKLKRMNIDTLKSLCEERGFSTEGSKAVLMNRLLGLSRE